MRIIPIQRSLEAFHFTGADRFVDLLEFVRGIDTQKINGNLLLDGNDVRAIAHLNNVPIKVHRYEWIIRTETGDFKVMNDTEFSNTYQRAA